MKHEINDDLAKAALALRLAWEESPFPSFKHTNYFRIYSELFRHLVGKRCTFIETGILEGGSLFMWRKWLGDRARIIGVDLNPQALKWKEHGFEILIGDQGNPDFWQRVFHEVGEFDALLDDGGHQSFQQIVTVQESLRHARSRCVIAVEDTHTNFASDFARHGRHSFLEYSKDATDVLLAKTAHFESYSVPRIKNHDIIDLFRHVHSIEFYMDIVAFKVDPSLSEIPEMIWNRPATAHAADFRYQGVNSANVIWPNMFRRQVVAVRGGKPLMRTVWNFFRRAGSAIRRRVIGQ
jgi:hypothetical protein